MPVVELTPQFLKSLQPAPGKSRTEWCDSLFPGLYVESRATSLGKGTYYLRYKGATGKTKHHRLGNTDNLSLNQARTQAQMARNSLLNGAAADESVHTEETLTLREFVEKHYLPYIKPRKRSYYDDELRLNARLLPAFGAQRMDTITRKQLVDFHMEIRNEGYAPATCDHYIKLIRYIFNLAIQWDFLTANPAAKIALFNADNKVENLLSNEQFDQLLKVLHTHPNRQACQVALFLLSTGARLNEALTATWEQIDLNEKVWRIPATNSKSKKLRAIPLNSSALEVLRTIMPEELSGWVFTNPRTGTRLKTLHCAWDNIRKTANLPFLRIHDLRHSFASLMVNSGRSLYEVQHLLGHSTPQVTTRYAHLSAGTLLSASESASDRIRAAAPRLPGAPATTAS
ncbi:MAG: tyrosine-type recombinase/integrase [Pseudohongiellaceae bacterium]|nr:tyrosine-type recombinase/integrase [Pseudohongiellaceae bacterium]